VLLAWLAVFHAAVSVRAEPWTGAGLAARRLVLLCSLVLLLPPSMAALFEVRGQGSFFYLSLGLLLGALALCLRRRPRDLFQASALVLMLNVQGVAWWARQLWSGALASSADDLGKFLLLGLLAACMLGLSVSALMRWSRAPRGEVEA